VQKVLCKVGKYQLEVPLMMMVVAIFYPKDGKLKKKTLRLERRVL